MKKHLFLLWILIFICGCATTHVAIKNNAVFAKYKKIYFIKMDEDPRKIQPKVIALLEGMGFEVIVTDKNEPVGGLQGSGFVISEDGYFLTTAHVLNKKENATIWISGKRYEAKLVYKEEDERSQEEDSNDSKKNIQERMESSLNSKDNKSIYEYLNHKDLALLKINLPESNVSFEPLIFAEDPSYKMGDEIYTIGFPLSHILGDSPRLNKGLISSTVGPKDNSNYLQISAEIQPGNSGGPLLNVKGQIIGMIKMTLNPMNVLIESGGNSLPQNVNFAFKNNVIEDFLKACPDKDKIKIKGYGSVFMDFDKAREAIGQVRSGIIPVDFKEQQKLVCSVVYCSFWDMWYRFSYLDIIFYDLDTGEILLRAGQYGNSPFSTEDGTLKKAFHDIEEKIGKIQ